MGIFNCATPIPMILLLIHGGLESAGTLLFMVLELKNYRREAKGNACERFRPASHLLSFCCQQAGTKTWLLFLWCSSPFRTTDLQMSYLHINMAGHVKTLASCWTVKKFTYGIYHQICVRATKFRTMQIISPTIVAKDFTHEDYPQYGIS